MLEEDEVQVARWVHLPCYGRARAAAAAVRAFAAEHGMVADCQRRLEWAVNAALEDAVAGDAGEPITSGRIDAALDGDWLTVRIEHDGFPASAPTLAALAARVEALWSSGPRGRENAMLEFECAMHH